MLENPIKNNAPCDRTDGFALVLVLVTLALLSAIAATFIITTTVNTKATANMVQGLKAQHLADAGVRLTAVELLQGRHGKPARLNADHVPFICEVREHEAILQVVADDEGGKVDLNTASTALLIAMFAGLADDPELAELYVDRLIDFRDSNENEGKQGAEEPAYRAAGLAYGPKNAPLNSIEELEQVQGIPYAIYVRALPYVTVDSGQSGLDVNVARPDLLSLLRRGAQLASTIGSAGPSGLPQHFEVPSRQRVFRIKATAHLASGFQYTRDAIVELVDRPDRPLVWRRWMPGVAGAPASEDWRHGGAC